MSNRRRAGGLSLIEVVVFIVVLGLGLAAIVTLFGQLTKASPHPVVRKQALALAESMMEEVLLRAFTFCDPDNANVFTATAATVAQCPGSPGIEAIGPETGETRYADPLFDNVSDYDTFSMSGASIKDITNTMIDGLGAYSVSVGVAQITGGELPSIADTTDALRVTVTATGPLGVSVTLQAYRTRYAPNNP